MTNSSKTKTEFYGWKNVILMFIFYLSGGGIVFYGFSVIFPTMIQTLDWNRGTASIAQSVNLMLIGLFSPLIAISINKIGTKKTLLLGIIFLIGGLFLMATVMSEMWQWIILWGFVISVGFSFAGWVPLQVMVMHWFNIKRATAMGIVLSGGALGGFLAQPFYTWLMSITHNSWKNGWFWGGVISLSGLICLFFMIGKPEDVGQSPDGLGPDEAEALKKKTDTRVVNYQTTREWTLKEVFKTPVLWFISIGSIAYALPLFLITTHGILHFTDMGVSQMQAASVMSFIILGSGLARIPAGWLSDRIGPRVIITVCLGVMLVTHLGLWLLSIPSILIVTGLMFGMCYGGLLIVFPTMVGNYFGPDTYAGINGVLGPILVGFIAIIPTGAGYLFEKNGNYDAAFIILGVVLFIGFLLSFFLSPPEEKNHETSRV